MKYKCATINGVSYGDKSDMTDQQINTLPPVKNVDFRDSQLFKDLKNTHSPNHNHIIEFLTMLAVCHTVITEYDKDTQQTEYNASSPDELALLYFAKFLGMEFTGIDENDNMTVTFQNTL